MRTLVQFARAVKRDRTSDLEARIASLESRLQALEKKTG
jgi:BMFP domain-containing protein YqiC